MTRKDYKETLEYELYGRFDHRPSLIHRFSIKHFHPNTNCLYLARKMWYFWQKGGIFKLFSKLLFIRIHRRYGCCIFQNAEIQKGLYIPHPVGIVIGKCSIGRNFTIYQNCTIGVLRDGDEQKGLSPVIGDNVCVTSGSSIFGKVRITNDVVTAANSVVLKDIVESGTYAGTPAQKVK